MDKNQLKFKKEKIILTASIGQCVHVAGTQNFISIAEKLGYNCIFLGPANSISDVIKSIKKHQPDIIGLSYRLTPETVKPLLKSFFRKYQKLDHQAEQLYFAGTAKVIEIVKQFKQFDRYFIGDESRYEIISILKNENVHNKINHSSDIPSSLISRLEWKKPFPLIRAHFGLPSLERTLQGIKKIAEAKVLDVISIAPDQNTQENFFHPQEQKEELSGAGGVPLRNVDDFNKLDKARQYGNTPLLRIYAGTRDFIKLAKLYNKTINNAWAAIPIFWFNQMDRRGPLSLRRSIQQHLEAIRWHGKRSIPVEINDPHHWSLRNAPDAIAVADMYLCGIIAKKLGVKHFIAQYMFNTPPNISFEMDLAKILAKNELLKTLENDSFRIITQVRTGLASFPLNTNKAKGQLAASSLIQLLLKPNIIHVVSFSEASHAAFPEDIIESCQIVDQVVKKMSSSNVRLDNKLYNERKESLIKQAKWIVNLIPRLTRDHENIECPWLNPSILSRLVELGIFDAPHLKNNRFGKGMIKTKVIKGGYDSINEYNEPISEIERISEILLDLDDYNVELISENQNEKVST
ncbi:MAG: hypothetical protein BAJALOKI3v1_1040013 [Promethearchaeota archaeon]|jgi:methylmalonyl-CoA mutase cobalamin-binding subunit|nr:MAG: hypothetical protein BAJALOKI3v1_1040013 [Candidatus Lokiarchaeota archaeon]